MKKSIATLSLLSAVLAAPVFAQEGSSPVAGVQKLDHVFLIMMENHGYSQIITNPNAPFINGLANSANLATNYFAVGHPSLTNYLEVVGGSNFGVQSDNASDWHNTTTCSSNLSTGVANTDVPSSSNICPISGTGKDAATPAVDYVNEVSPGQTALNNLDGVLSIPQASNISGKSIADQLVMAGKSWKSYQESIPTTGVDNVNYSDGLFSNLTDFTTILPAQNPALNNGQIVSLYAAKHNPFVYFQNIQQGQNPALSLSNTTSFDGGNGLFADLSSGNVPAFSFIVPNQCNDQHGRGNAGPFCNYDPITDGSQAGLNPALIQLGDVAVEKLVTAIKSSPVWNQGHNAIVVLWDENDYSNAPNVNQVAMIVDTSYGPQGVKSNNFYTHFSLLKTLEGGFGLPCLNHACDSTVNVISDLFGAGTPVKSNQKNHGNDRY
jgi:hypothetical protein